MYRLMPFLLFAAIASGCATRQKLSSTHLKAAAEDKSLGLASLYVYPSNRTLTRYRRGHNAPTTPGRVIEEYSDREKLTFVLNKSTAGVVIADEVDKGARQLWVCFDRVCAPEDAYGFVQVDARSFRLNAVPNVDGFSPGQVHRGAVTQRCRMKRGKLASLADTHDIYRLTHKRYGGRTVFLEVKVDRDRSQASRREPHIGR